MEVQKLLRIISSFAVLLPVAAGLLFYRNANRLHRMLVFFLSYGFLTDLLCWYFFVNGNIQTAHALFNIYSLAEFLFYFWFLSQLGTFKFLKKYRVFIYILFSLSWAFIYIGQTSDEVSLSGVFNAAYTVLFVIMSSYLLIRYVETKGSITTLPEFWMCAAIFFYCINVFFIFQLLGSSFVQKIWFIQNIVNILTAVILTAGFFMLQKGKEAAPLGK